MNAEPINNRNRDANVYNGSFTAAAVGVSLLLREAQLVFKVRVMVIARFAFKVDRGVTQRAPFSSGDASAT